MVLMWDFYNQESIIEISFVNPPDILKMYHLLMRAGIISPCRESMSIMKTKKLIQVILVHVVSNFLKRKLDNKSILHRIISVVWVTIFLSENRSHLQPCWWGVALAQWREKGEKLFSWGIFRRWWYLLWRELFGGTVNLKGHYIKYIWRIRFSGEACLFLRYCNTRPTHDKVLAS